MKEFWENNLNCKEIKSETITYQTINDISIEKISVKFDYVIRNMEEDIVAVGMYIEQEDEEGLNKYYEKIRYDFPYPAFFIDEAGCLFFIDNNKFKIKLPGNLFNYDLPPIHFIELLKKWIGL